MKQLLPLLILLLIQNTLFSQDTTAPGPPDGSKKRGPGIYVTEKEFLDGKPSIVAPFKLVPVYKIWYDESTNLYDTLESLTSFEFLDSTIPKPKKTYALYDGSDFYLNNINSFVKFDYVGRFSFITFLAVKTKVQGLPLALMVSLVDRLIARPPDLIYYFNKKRYFIEASSKTIAWLLKDDGDFAKEFRGEKDYNNEVFRKYLLKMNERYPE